MTTLRGNSRREDVKTNKKQKKNGEDKHDGKIKKKRCDMIWNEDSNRRDAEK